MDKGYEIQLEQKWNKSTNSDYECDYKWMWTVYIKPSWVAFESGWDYTEEGARLKAKQAAKLHHLRKTAKEIKEDYNPGEEE